MVEISSCKLTLYNLLVALEKKGFDDFDLVSYYIPEFKQVNKKFKLRCNDPNASVCTKISSVIINSKLFNRILINDFGELSKACTIENWLINDLGLPNNVFGYLAVLDKIRKDFNIEGLDYYHGKYELKKALNPPILKKQSDKLIKSSSSTIIRFHSPGWNDKNVLYWKEKYKILTTTLELYNVFPITHYWINNWMFEADKDKSYCYIVNDKRKIYQPLISDKSRKWYANTTKEDVQGWIQLPEKGELLIITKALKDIMCLYQHFGINAVAPGSETSFIPEDKLEELRKRFKRIIILFDNDKQGMISARHFSELYKLEYFYLPTIEDNKKIKDISDYIDNFNLEYTKQLLNKLINEEKKE